MNILGVIPARFASTRFPGKPLAKIQGKPMVQCVYERCVEAGCFYKIVVATDNQEIYDVVKSFGGEVIMTDATHTSGTDRCFEALDLIGGADALINIQGDEPFIQPSSIAEVARLLKENAEVATLAVKAIKSAQITDVNKVKVVLGQNSDALYFSRSVIPYQRNSPQKDWVKNADYFIHLGIYGFNNAIVGNLQSLEPSKLELLESLEQLRWLENGYKIRVGIVKEAPMGVDTPNDLEQLNKMLETGI